MSHPSPLDVLLARYSVVEQQLAALNEEREQIRTQVKTHLQAAGRNYLIAHPPQSDAYEVAVRHRVNVVYDEVKLRQRLGERYRLILEPDLKKLRQNLPHLKPALEPFLETIGTPAPERVEERIRSGEVTVAEFRGAFAKTRVNTLIIRRAKII